MQVATPGEFIVQYANAIAINYLNFNKHLGHVVS